MYFSIFTLSYVFCLLFSVSSTLGYDTSPPSPETLSAITTIKNVISLKSLLTANKEYTLLPQILTEDVVLEITGANVDKPISISGLAELISYFTVADGTNVITRESTSQFVELTSPTDARAVSNTQENYFGQGDLKGQIYGFFERAEDQLRVDNGTWKIYKSTLTLIGAPVGNPSVYITG